MGDNQTGGGGSVYWSVDGKRVDETGPRAPHNKHTGHGNGPHHQDGIDNDGAIGDDFTVSIKVPKEFDSAEAYLEQFKWQIDQGGKRIYFNLPIEDDPDQVHVSWGESENRRVIGVRKPTAT
jgi:hypothetical protein